MTLHVVSLIVVLAAVVVMVGVARRQWVADAALAVAMVVCVGWIAWLTFCAIWGQP